MQSRRALVDVQQDRRRLQVPHAEAAGAQRSRGDGSPVLQQQLDVAHELVSGPGCRLVDEPALA